MKRVMIFLLAVVLPLTLAACRSRTTTETAAGSVVAANAESGQTTPDDSAAPTPVREAAPQTTEPVEPEPDADAPAEEDPDSPRKTYSDRADAALTPGVDTAVLAPTDRPAGAPAAPPSDAEADGAAGGSMETEQANQTVTETVPAEEAEDLGAAEDAPVAESLLAYYQTLLDDRLSSLFECQRLYVYWETQSALTTVFKTSAEHQLLLDAGAYDVAARLLEENLTVDAAWIQHKNPGMIVKVVPQEILGGGVQSTAAAQTVREDLLTREGISGTDAAKKRNVLLLSPELMTTQTGRTAAALYLAKALYPNLFADVDPLEALRLLREEAGGEAAGGIYAYAG